MAEDLTSIGHSLRQWRQLRKMSQLELALAANVSTRHISFIETGKSQPTREMIIKLAQAMQLTASQQKALLLSAGYQPETSQSLWHSEQMRPVQQLVIKIVEQFNPYPSCVFDNGFDLLFMNTSCRRLLNAFGIPPREVGPLNLYQAVFEGGLYKKVANWSEVQAFMIARLRETTFGAANDALLQLATTLSPQMPKHLETTDSMTTFNTRLILHHEDTKLYFNAVLLTLGTAYDVAPHEWRITVLLPANKGTEVYCVNL